MLTSSWISTAARPIASGWRRLPATPIAPRLEVAQAALTLALESKEKQRVEDPRLRARRAHVGYYLIDHGFPLLAPRVGYRPRFIDRLRQSVWNNADDFYIGGIQIITVVLIGLILAPLVPTYPIFGGLTLAFLLLLLPATQGAVDLVNNTVTVLFKAYACPSSTSPKGCRSRSPPWWWCLPC